MAALVPSLVPYSVPASGSSAANTLVSIDQETLPPKEQGRKRPAILMFSIGTCVLLCLSVIPIWDAYYMWQNPVIQYFVGVVYPACVLAVCGAGIVLFAVTVCILFGFNAGNAKTKVKVMPLINVTNSVLGMIFILLSAPLRSISYLSSTAILWNCQHDSLTASLYKEYVTLHELRGNIDCKGRSSVTKCDGYNSTAGALANLLYFMEERYSCAGFCVEPPFAALWSPVSKSSPTTNPSSSVNISVNTSANKSFPRAESTEWPANGSVDALGTVVSINENMTPHALLAFSEDVNSSANEGTDITSLLQNVAFTSHRQLARVKPKPLELSNYLYPPTLFSDGNHQASCSNMVLSDLAFRVQSTSNIFFIQGMILLVCVALSYLHQFCGFCLLKPRHQAHPNYVMR